VEDNDAVTSSAPAPGAPPGEIANRQMLGCTVILTAQRRAAELGAALGRRGATVIHAPVLSIVPHVDDDELLARTRRILDDGADVVVVTTGIGFRGWIEAADAAGLAEPLLELLTTARVVARGPKARGALQAAGITPDWVAESETAAEIRDFLLTEGVAGSRVVVQHHGSGGDGLDEAFDAAGAVVTSLVVYRWGPAPDPEAVAASVRRVAGTAADAVVFTSAPGAAAWLDVARELSLMDQVVHACNRADGVLATAVGDITAGPLRAVGIDPLVPDRARIGALVRALSIELAERHGLRVETVAGTLRMLRGAAVLDDRVLPLSPSVLTVLRCIAEANGAVVSRDDLLAALPGLSADAHAVEVAIARLRDAAGSRDLIRTVIKRGYRLETRHTVS
jgi:uroporphyrinogen-III synthase